MAYVQQQIPKEEQNNNANPNPTQSPIPPQGSSAGTVSPGGRATPGTGTSTQFGSNASKLSDYLDANKEQVGQYGQQIGQDLTNRYNSTTSAIDQGFGNFNQQVQSQYTPPNPSDVQGALNNPQDFVKNPSNVQKFQSWYNPQYQGPQNFESSPIYSDINNQVNKAVQDANLAGTQAGLGTYLNNYMGANDTTTGMQTLDTALLMRNPDSATAIRNAVQPFQNLSGYLSDATSKADQGVQNVKDQINQSGANVRSQTKSATDQLTNDIQKRISDLTASANNQDPAFQQAILGGMNLTPTEQQRYGISNWDQIRTLENELSNPVTYGSKSNLSPYFTTSNPQDTYTMANVATPEQYAREAALQQLTQGQFNILPDDASQAGKAPTSLLSFNSQQAAQDLQNKLTNLDTQFIQNRPAAFNGFSDRGQQGVDSNGKPVYAPDDWRTILGDRQTAAAYQGVLDIFNRNPNLTNSLQKNTATQLQDWLTQLYPNGGLGSPSGTGTSGGSPNLRTITGPNGTGQNMWFNGSQWVSAPSETKQNSDGSWSKFNYDTGQYEPMTTSKPPVLGIGGGTAGIY